MHRTNRTKSIAIFTIFTILTTYLWTKPVPRPGQLSWLRHRAWRSSPTPTSGCGRAFLHGDVVARADGALGRRASRRRCTWTWTCAWQTARWSWRQQRRVAPRRAFGRGTTSRTGTGPGRSRRRRGRRRALRGQRRMRRRRRRRRDARSTRPNSSLPTRSTARSSRAPSCTPPRGVADARWTRSTRSEAFESRRRGRGKATTTTSRSDRPDRSGRSRAKKVLRARLGDARADQGVVFEVRAAEVTVRWLACARKSRRTNTTTRERRVRARRGPPDCRRRGRRRRRRRCRRRRSGAGTSRAPASARDGTVVPETPPKSHVRTRLAGRRRRSAKLFLGRRQRFP